LSSVFLAILIKLKHN
jgi:ABC-2 type transport system ATP-binding protein